MKAMSLRGQLGEIEAAIENGDTSCQNHVSGGQGARVRAYGRLILDVDVDNADPLDQHAVPAA